MVQETGWTPRPVWADAENLAPTGIRSPDRTARNEPLHRLSYRGLTEAVYTVHNLSLQFILTWDYTVSMYKFDSIILSEVSKLAQSDGQWLCTVQTHVQPPLIQEVAP